MDLLNIETPSSSVDILDLTGSTLVRSSDNGHDIIPSDRKRLDSVLLLEFFAKRGRHDCILDMAGSGEVGESLFSSLVADIL